MRRLHRRQCADIPGSRATPDNRRTPRSIRKSPGGIRLAWRRRSLEAGTPGVTADDDDGAFLNELEKADATPHVAIPRGEMVAEDAGMLFLKINRDYGLRFGCQIVPTG